MVGNINKNSTLNAPGMKMPIIGIGTWQATEAEIEIALNSAIEAGYRHIDTALVYMNEAAIGKTLKKWFDSGKIKREELFIVTKLPPPSNDPKYVEESIKLSLKDLQLDYLDLYLIHHPVGLVHEEDKNSPSGFNLLPKNSDGKVKIDVKTDHIALWKAMEEQVDAGRTKAIGVSNFNVQQIERIMKSARILPATNQVEMYLYCQQKELQEYSKKSGVTITAYGPLGSPGLEKFVTILGGKAEDIKNLNPLEDPVVLNIAKTHNKLPSQILLRHLLQLGVAVIPKSSYPTRIQGNYDVFNFELTESEMSELNALDRGKEGQRFLVGVLTGIEDHPEYPFK
uniref:NADP-dependent oxidoreductase domain-containing protein n=1 Tax=Clastoptera arizonana TaxID=38151 RepID=A0A1B6EEA9_9HEMI